MALIDKLTNIADATREKTGESGKLTLDAVAAAIRAIEKPLSADDVEFPFLYADDGTKFPPIPAGVTKNYPYAVIRKNERTGYYELYCSKFPWFYTSSQISNNYYDIKQLYQIEIASLDTVHEWVDNSTFSSASFPVSSDRTIIWTSHDIPNGSATATDIWLQKSSYLDPEFYSVSTENILDITNAIRNRNGDVYTMTIGDIPSEIANIQGPHPNGMIWTQSNITSGSFYSIHYVNGVWIARSDTYYYYSTDGMTWTKTDVKSDRFRGIHNANGLWVAGGSSTGLYYSTDGKTWTQSNVTSGNYNGIHNANGLWVAGGSSTGIYYSTDGKIWTQSNVTSGSFSSFYNANGIWVARGSGFYYSTDGKTWTQSNVTSGSFYTVHNANGIWVAGNGTDSSIYYSTDGMTWTKSDVAVFYRTLVYGNGIWITAGSKDTGVYYSTDGKTWTQSNVTSGYYPVVDFSNGVFTAAFNGTAGLYYSTDGMVWTKSNAMISPESGDSSDSRMASAVSYANGLWVARGNAVGIYYSTDGKTWTQSNVTSGSFYTVHNANGIWVAGGNNGLYYSPTWLPL